jgi:glycosyltransferase involved in cell wall biosynthesis
MLLFPKAIGRIKPRLVFSFYHDVLLPPGASGIASVMMIHDTCLHDLAGIYPTGVRLYYLALLRANLMRARHILTISQATRERIIARYGVGPERLSVVYNAVAENFAAGSEVESRAKAIRERYAPSSILLYTGGSEYRKNILNLVGALDRLRQGGRRIRLLTTGARDQGWARALDGRDAALSDVVTFLGWVSHRELEAHYAAADAVVYPSLCEGFGRVCIEAMAAGTPLACSDLPALREVAFDYAHYFDPHDAGSIASGIEQAMTAGHRSPRRDLRFTPAQVEASFLQVMDRLTDELSATK